MSEPFPSLMNSRSARFCLQNGNGSQALEAAEQNSAMGMHCVERDAL